MDVPKPNWEPLLLRCGGCGQEWDDWQPTGCALSVWLAVIEALRCPHCGAERHLFMRSAE